MNEVDYCSRCGAPPTGIHWPGCQTKAEPADLRAEIIVQLWPDVLAGQSLCVEPADDVEGVVRRLVWDGVLSEEAADELRRIVGLS